MNNPTLEIWKPVVGYEGTYEVSNLGNIRRLTMRGGRALMIPRKIKPWLTHGYPTVKLSLPNKRVDKKVSILVLRSFVGPRPAKTHGINRYEVSHLDGDRSNDRLTNLAYESSKDNAQRRILHGTSGRGEQNSTHKFTITQVRQMRKLRLAGWDYSKIAAKFHNRRDYIYLICTRKRWGWLDDKRRST